MNKKTLLAVIITVATLETMIIMPQYTHWAALVLLIGVFLTTIEKDNTSYSLIGTAILAQLAIIGTILFTESNIIEQFLTLSAAILTYTFVEPAQKKKHIDRKGRNETVTQRIIQAGLLGIMVLWYNVSIKIAEDVQTFEIPLIIPLIIMMVITTIITFHLQKTIPVAFNRRKAIMFAIMSAYVVTQIGWISLLWPFSLLTKTIILTVVFYLLWNVIELEKKKIFSLKTMMPHLVTAIIIVILAIATSPWQL